ncbi:MAG: helix-turn-helix domain-containing protein [Agathobacter sp.]
MDITSRNVGEKIASLRKQMGITQAQLAEFLCCTPQNVSRWEVGNGLPETMMIPRIASFFGVTTDELIGQSTVEKAKELVIKYSVLRDDKTLSEAKSYINSCINSLEAEKDNGVRALSEILEEEKTIKALRVHLHLQQARQTLEEGEKFAKELLSMSCGESDPWDLKMRLQILQFRQMQGFGVSLVQESLKAFFDEPTLLNLRIYTECLWMFDLHKEIIDVRDIGIAAPILYPMSKENVSIWKVMLEAAFIREDMEFIENNKDDILGLCSDLERYALVLSNSKMCKKQNDIQKYEALVEEAKELLNRLELNEYFAISERKMLEDTSFYS